MSGTDLPRRTSDEPFTFRGSVPGSEYLDGAGLLQDDDPEHDGGRCHSGNGSHATDGEAPANGADATRRHRDNGGANDQAEAADENQSEPRQPPIWLDSDDWTESDIPRRPWVAPGYALRGAVTLVCGPPSAMKSSLMLGWGCSIALQRDYGRFRPVTSGPVIIFNVEDDRVEQRRRLSAVLRHFGATPADVKGKVIRTGPTSVGTLFVRNDRGCVVPTDAMRRLEQLIEQQQPSALIVDPFSELHTAEENDNTAIRAVVAAFRALAVKHNIAVILLHHTSKARSASPGDPDAARGASATIGAVRIALTVTGMSEDDAEAFGIPTDRQVRSNYVRVDDAKQNYAPIRDAAWFEKVPHKLENGEIVPAAHPWTPPEARIATQTDLAALATAIERGASSGEPWSPQLSDSPRSVRHLLCEHGFTRSDDQKTALQRLQRECAVETPYFQSASRNKAKGLRSRGLPRAKWEDDSEETHA